MALQHPSHRVRAPGTVRLWAPMSRSMTICIAVHLLGTWHTCHAWAPSSFKHSLRDRARREVHRLACTGNAPCLAPAPTMLASHGVEGILTSQHAVKQRSSSSFQLVLCLSATFLPLRYFSMAYVRVDYEQGHRWDQAAQGVCHGCSHLARRAVLHTVLYRRCIMHVLSTIALSGHSRSGSSCYLLEGVA